MTAPRFVEDDNRPPRLNPVGTLAQARPAPSVLDPARVAERRRLFRTNFDMYLAVVVGVLLSIGLMMVFSTTFDWSYQVFGDASTVFLQQVNSTIVGLIIMTLLALIDYRVWRRFALLLMLTVVALLITVLLVASELFGAQRALFEGRIQPGEFAELVTVIYMAAWLSAKQTKIKRITYGLIPFTILIGVVAGLIVLQPDLSTAALILLTAETMFFLAGAAWLQIGATVVVVLGAGWILVAQVGYASARLVSYLSSVSDLTTASYHVQQVMLAFRNGGLTGVGLGEGRQKFGFLPAAHTDSIFAMVGEELGLIGCALIIVLFVVLAVRGFRIARSAPNNFGALMAAGITCWIVYKALLNVAVMTALIPFSGVSLPFISFGGSSLVTALAGMGLLLSVSRIAARESGPDQKRKSGADHHLGWRNGGRDVPRVRRRRSASES